MLVWADTLVNQSIALVKELQEKILALKIPNAKSPTEQYLTASIGLVDMYPNDTHSIKELISIADTHLYQAKGLGRNQVKY